MRNKHGPRTPSIYVEKETDERPPVARYGTRIVDLRDGAHGTVLGHYGMAFAAVMDNDEVRYFGKTNPRFCLADAGA